MKSLTFRVPARIDPDCIPRAVRDCGYWFLDLLHRQYVRWQFDGRGFVPLKADYIRRVIPWRVWPGLRDRLESMGVIQCDHRYLAGAKCYGYRLHPACIPSRCVVCSDGDITRKVLALRQESRERLLPVHCWLESWLYRLSFDSAAALRIIETLRPDAGCPLPVDEYRTLLREQCARMAERERYLTVDAYGRVHTPVTSLPKLLRCSLSCAGQPFVGLDLANSQPLFAGLVARAYCQSSDRNRRRLRKRRFAENGRVEYDTRRMQDTERAGREGGGGGDGRGDGATTPCITMHREPFEPIKQGVSECADPSVLGDSPPDLAEYLRLCETGQLYESLMQPGDARDDIKRRLFVVLYGKPQWRSDIGRRFRQRFSTVAGVLADLKRDEYRRSAWVMQHSESSLFIGAVCGQIARERPAVPLLTIHDSLLTTQEHVGYVESVLMDKFERMGVHPTLHEESYA